MSGLHHNYFKNYLFLSNYVKFYYAHTHFNDKLIYTSLVLIQ